MAKYSNLQWKTAEDTYKFTGSYKRANEKSGIPVNNIKVKSVRKSWKRDKDTNVYRIYTEIANEIKEESKEEIKTVLEKIQAMQKFLENDIEQSKTVKQKLKFLNTYINYLWLEGKITGEISNK